MDADKLSPDTNGMATRVEADGLCETVQRLKAVLKPVEPFPAFREALRLRLVRSARKERGPVQVAASSERRREVLVGAALLSVAGALVYLWRSRTLQDTPPIAALLEDGPPAQELPTTA